MSVEPGWYADPADPTTQRYWDGEGWIGRSLPVDATPPPGPPAEEEQPAQPEPAPATPADQPPGQPHPQPPSGPPHPTDGHPPGYPGGSHPGGYPTGGFPAGGYPGGDFPAGGYPGGGYPPGYPAAQPRPHGMALAPLEARLLARVIDIFVVFALNVAVNGWFVYRYVLEVLPVYREAFRRSAAGNYSTEDLPQVGDQAGSLQLVIVLIAAALWFAYEVPALAETGQTLGKRLMRIRVVSLTEEPDLSFGRSFRRWNTLGLPTLLWFCCVGFVLQLIDCVYPLFDRPLRQALHDKRAQTVVVQLPLHGAAPATPADRRHDDPRPGGTP